jgi:hypothetical protein
MGWEVMMHEWIFRYPCYLLFTSNCSLKLMDSIELEDIIKAVTDISKFKRFSELSHLGSLHSNQ